MMRHKGESKLWFLKAKEVTSNTPWPTNCPVQHNSWDANPTWEKTVKLLQYLHNREILNRDSASIYCFSLSVDYIQQTNQMIQNTKIAINLLNYRCLFECFARKTRTLFDQVIKYMINQIIFTSESTTLTTWQVLGPKNQNLAKLERWTSCRTNWNV